MPTPDAAWNFNEASGAVIDLTGNGHGFTMVGTTVRSADVTADGTGYTGKGLTQTSAGSTDAGPAIFGQTANRTLECWIKSTAQVTDGRAFEHVAPDANSTWEFLFRDAVWHLQAWNASTFGRASFARPADSAWHFLTGTYDGTNLKVYLDAVLKTTTALAGPLRTDATVFNVLHSTGSATIFRHVRMYGVALTQAEIAADMALAVGAPSAPAFAAWGVPL